MTIYRLTWDEALKSIKTGRAVRIPGQSIRDYLGVPEPEDLTAWLTR
jgi:hypothetical protein